MASTVLGERAEQRAGLRESPRRLSDLLKRPLRAPREDRRPPCGVREAHGVRRQIHPLKLLP